jgi:hypothetical protein
VVLEWGISLQPKCHVRGSIALRHHPHRWRKNRERLGNKTAQKALLSMNPVKINEYRLLVSQRAEELEAQVNELLKSGWQPLGAPQVVCPVIEQGPAPAFYQAMVSESRPVTSERIDWAEFCETTPTAPPAPPPLP